MRKVYDTNVLVGILVSRDKILQLKKQIMTGQLTLVTSDFILDELERVLTLRFKMTKSAAKARTRLIARISEKVNPKIIDKISRDPNDDNILATAKTGNCTHIITIDKDLLVLGSFDGIVITKPE